MALSLPTASVGGVATPATSAPSAGRFNQLSFQASDAPNNTGWGVVIGEAPSQPATYGDFTVKQFFTFDNLDSVTYRYISSVLTLNGALTFNGSFIPFTLGNHAWVALIFSTISPISGTVLDVVKSAGTVVA